MFNWKRHYFFEASHSLPNSEGVERRLHGHSWTLIVEVQSQYFRMDETDLGVVILTEAVDAIVEPLLRDSLFHRHLNSSTKIINPTPERLCMWIYNKIKPSIHCLKSIELKANGHIARFEGE